MLKAAGIAAAAASWVLVLATALVAPAHGATSLTAHGAPGPAARQCPEHLFDCRNGQCIRGSVWCNGIDDCGNNADELTCRVCLSGSVKCKASTQCILSQARCNGKTECQDGSDEFGCENVTEKEATRTEAKETSESGASNLERSHQMPSSSDNFAKPMSHAAIIFTTLVTLCLLR